MDEFLGLGRTWWVAILIIVAATVMAGLGKLDVDKWTTIVQWVFTVAGGKSAIVGASQVLKKK